MFVLRRIIFYINFWRNLPFLFKFYRNAIFSSFAIGEFFVTKTLPRLGLSKKQQKIAGGLVLSKENSESTRKNTGRSIRKLVDQYHDVKHVQKHQLALSAGHILSLVGFYI